MSMRFSGKATVKVDGKGRMALPARFRRVLQANDSGWVAGEGPRLHIAFGNHRVDTVECLSGDAYDALCEKIEAMDEGEDDREFLEDLYFTHCEEVTVDDAGRFSLPLEAREKLNLEGEATFKGRGGRFLIAPKDDEASTKDLMEERFQRYGGDNQNYNPVALTNKKKEPVGDDET